MGEYASKGVAGTGLGLGIAGTALGVLAGTGNGLLGGLFGNNTAAAAAQGAAQAVLAEKDAKIAQLESEKYSDQSGIALFERLQTNINNNATKAFNDLTTVRTNILSEWVKPLAQESAANRERLVGLEATVAGNKALQDKENEMIRKEIEIANLKAQAENDKLNGKIDMVAMQSSNGLNCLGATVAQLQKTVGSITQLYVPSSAITPELMPRFNSWTAPTATASDTTTVTGTVNAT